MGRDEDYELEASFGYWIFRLNRAMSARFSARLAEHGVSGPEWSLLGHAARGGKTPVGLADEMAIDRAAVTRLIDGLESKGLIARTRHPTDRRSTVLALTDRGRELYPKLVAASREINRSFLELLPPEDAVALNSLIRKLGERLPGPIVVAELGRG